MMKFLLVLLISFNSFGYSPPVESLFRNNNNSEVFEKGTTLGFQITNQESSESIYAQLSVFDLETERRKFIQVLKKSAQEKTALSVSQHAELRNMISDKKTESTEQKLFYSIINMLLRNDSEMM